MLAVLVVCAVLASCSGGGVDTDSSPVDAPVEALGDGFELSAFPETVTIVEGAPDIDIPIVVLRGPRSDSTVTLSLAGDAAGASGVRATLVETTLEAGQTRTRLQARVELSAAPTRATQTMLSIRAEGGGDVQTVSLPIDIEPTDRPDVYLLIGQSNMVGDSQPGSRRAAAGEPDAPDPRILQLNVTTNADENFAGSGDFSSRAANVRSPALVIAEDPLHGIVEDVDAGQIGPALSFAKAALANTTSDIVLVPAAFGGTGFCGVPALDTSWNADATGNPILGGTGLFDRAVLRTDLAIAESGGILRGILWMHGETDSNNFGCARLYGENLTRMVEGLRTRIAVDARGESARGAGAPIPFVAGTFSKGDDGRGTFSDLTEPERIVDGVLKNVGSTIPAAAVAVNDDLVPPAFPCGETSCIHFGASAYRTIGQRLYERLNAVAVELDR